jgi:hypothetical protein
MMLATSQDLADAAQLVKDLASYAEAKHTFLHWFHLLPLGRRLREDASVTHVLLTVPPISDAGFSTVQLEGKRIDILWVVPITESEWSFARRQGIDALEELLERTNANVLDLRRASTV